MVDVEIARKCKLSRIAGLFLLGLFLLVGRSQSLLAAKAVASAGPRNSNIAMRLSKGDSNGKEKLKSKTWNPLRLAVLRLGLTEPAMLSPLNYGKYDGKFKCAYCGNVLFDSDSKYDSKSGWPSFWRSSNENSISYKREFDGRVECTCKQCRSHLGHVFTDGPRRTSVDQTLLEQSPASDPRGKQDGLPRFCVNGASLTFEKATSTTQD